MKLGLERWITGVKEWQKPYRTQKTYWDRRDHTSSLPLGNSVWLVRLHREEILNYAQYRVTNALTERTNAKIRKLLRAGHRYSPETLVTLVNRELESQPSTGRAVTPTVWLPEKKGRAAETTSPVVELALPPKQPEPLLPPPIPADFDYQNLPIPEPLTSLPPSLPPVLRVRKPRHLPYCAPELGLPEPIWVWLHTKQSRQLGSPAWVKRLMEYAPPVDIAAWHLLCAGQVSGVGMPVIEARQLELWRATALWLYVQHHPDVLNARERERQPFLAGLDLRTLAHLQPEVISPLCAAWLTLVERFASLPLELEGLMLTVIHWQQLSELEGQQAITAFHTGIHKDRSIWDSWCSAAVGQVELMHMVVRWRRHLDAPGLPMVTLLVTDPELRWLTALEWAAAQAVEMETLGPLQRLHAFKKTVKLLDEHSMRLGI
ncbi:hypothetical protein Dxin01_04233 [Deinococcus xinjiangensis]|uniref:Transposase IS204/IS1001/IS1096/IS1165 DDE domain-containing protein n=1 Tax=Deinococcus xinjiangensis TaxID=457454 RepID=A0ABP9VGV3_9DEIO